MVNVRQDHIVLDLPRLANMAWTLDLAKREARGLLVQLMKRAHPWDGLHPGSWHSQAVPRAALWQQKLRLSGYAH